MLLAIGTAVWAADVTEFPDRLGGRVTAGWAGQWQRADLLQDDVHVSERHVSRQGFDLGLEFAPVRVLAATLHLETVPSLIIDYPDSVPMIFEPLSGAGSYPTTETAPAPYRVEGSGVSGLWLGVAAAPWSESRNESHARSWRLDVAFRPGSKGKNLWTGPIDARGVAAGGSALRFSGAFSRTRGQGEPWVAVGGRIENRAEIDLTDIDGTDLAKAVLLRAASRFHLAGGVSWRPIDNEDNTLALGPTASASWDTWADHASGVWLPNTLEAGRTIPVTSGETVTGAAGALVRATVGGFGVRANFDVALTTPHHPEHLYEVSTQGTRGVSAGLQFSYRQGFAGTNP